MHNAPQAKGKATKIAQECWNGTRQTLEPRKTTARSDAPLAFLNYVGGAPLLRRWETAVTSCAGANGFANIMLFGTPLDAQSATSLPVI
jgi:hypothetical protein